jgi:hypothetical protein
MDVKSYSETMFSKQERAMLATATRIVGLIPDRCGKRRHLTRCHEVARIVSRVLDELGVRAFVQDGVYGLVDHSWLWTSEPEADWMKTPMGIGCPNILDPYCVGSLPQVRLVGCAQPALPHFGSMYQVRDRRSDINMNFVVRTANSIIEAWGYSLPEVIIDGRLWRLDLRHRDKC